jgi:hypothetical protein
MPSPPSPSSTSWHSAASSSSSFTLSIHSQTPSSSSSRSERRSRPSRHQSLVGEPLHGEPLDVAGDRATSSPIDKDEKPAQGVGVNNAEAVPTPRNASRRSVKKFSLPSSSLAVIPAATAPPVPPLHRPTATEIPATSKSLAQKLRSTSEATDPVETNIESPTVLAYLTPSPLQTACSVGGFEAIGKIALGNSALKSGHPGDDRKSLSGLAPCPPDIERELPIFTNPIGDAPPRYSKQAPPPAVLSALAGDRVIADSERITQEVAHRRTSQTSEDREVENVDTKIEPFSPIISDSKKNSMVQGSIEIPIDTKLTWKERFQKSLQAYEDPNASSHSLPRFHRIVEPAVLLLPLLISFYLVGSAIVPFEWWRAHLSIARVGLAGQSAESDDRMVEGEEIGLFGVWGWCVMNSDEM